MFRRDHNRKEEWPVPLAERVQGVPESRKRKLVDEPAPVEEPDRWVEEPTAEFVEPSPPEVVVQEPEYDPSLVSARNGETMNGSNETPSRPQLGGESDDLRETVRWLVTAVQGLTDKSLTNGDAAQEPSSLESSATEPSAVEEPHPIPLDSALDPDDDDPPRDERVRLDTATAAADGDFVLAEVVLFLSGQRLAGSGRGHAGREGTLLAAARACIDALAPVLSHGVQIEGIYTAQASQNRELLMVSLVVGEELLVGSGRIPEGEEALSAARAVLDALNRQLSRLVGSAT